MQETQRRDIPLACLRTFLVLLVVLHHAVIAYCRFTPPPPPSLDAQPLLWTAFPIVDTKHWGLADLIVGFNDTFFMSLVFLIAGVFTWTSLERKGAKRYMADRARRLGIPFIISAGVLAPLAYYPSWLANVAPIHGGSFLRQWLAIGVWPAGPAWFLWVLLAFSAMTAIAYRVAPAAGVRLGRAVDRLGTRPIVLYALVVAALLAAYLPVTSVVDPMRWLSWGPFFVQATRVPHYFLYFVLGTGLGSAGTHRGFLQPDGRLARRWLAWALLALVAFVVETGAVVASISAAMHGHPDATLATFCNAGFVVSCTTTSFAFLAIFTRFATRPRPVVASLDSNGYAIYLLHYACVTWLQYALLATDLPGAAKAILVFAGAVAVSWCAGSVLRRVPAIARYL